MKTIFLMFLSLCCSTHSLSIMNSFHFLDLLFLENEKQVEKKGVKPPILLSRT